MGFLSIPASVAAEQAAYAKLKHAHAVSARLLNPDLSSDHWTVSPEEEEQTNKQVVIKQLGPDVLVYKGCSRWCLCMGLDSAAV